MRRIRPTPGRWSRSERQKHEHGLTGRRPRLSAYLTSSRIEERSPLITPSHDKPQGRLNLAVNR
ncbi:MAG: hypothetical protein AAGC44_14210 [Planctomycetota bacterium]